MASIVATEGLTGLLRRGGGKAFRALTGRAHPDTARHVAEPRREQEREAARTAEMVRQKIVYAEQVEQFRAAVQRRALGNVEGFYWYHTIDLGDGFVTPGDFDFRGPLSGVPLPARM